MAVAKSTLVASVLFGGISLALFFYFLFLGPLFSPWLKMTDTQILLWDCFLSLLFCVQHSVMVRRPVRDRLTKHFHNLLYPAFYSIVSGVTLLLVLLFWQESSWVVLDLQGAAYWIARALGVGALLGFAWEVVSLGSLFDPFGVNAVRDLVKGNESRPPQFILQGPYRYVRHPLYGLMLILMWSMPHLSADRLVFNGIWTFWIFAAIHLEERDLIHTFGEQYVRYRAAVPMLIPRGPAKLE